VETPEIKQSRRRRRPAADRVATVSLLRFELDHLDGIRQLDGVVSMIFLGSSQIKRQIKRQLAGLSFCFYAQTRFCTKIRLSKGKNLVRPV
jgi:hypothetical protein